MEITSLFKGFFDSERSGGYVLIVVTIISLLLTNLFVGEEFAAFFHQKVGFASGSVNLKLSIEHWVNDGLMVIFFLLVGLEIERELYVGELSSFRNALLPILAAIGGMAVPALVHFLFNKGTVTQGGFGIPMATDIAFALGILSLAGDRVPVSLKIFLTALAIIDDLGAITVIAIFYTTDFSLTYLLIALGVWALLFVLGKRKIYSLWIYIPGGLVMWYCMLHSGVHATIAGVLLAFAIPFNKQDQKSSSYHLQHILHKPVAFLILPIFALVNTAIVFPDNILESFTTPNAIGIITGLLFGKFIGILGTSYAAIKTGIAELPSEVNLRMMTGVALLGGIGFTMSIFITNLAFKDGGIITGAKMSILIASLIAALLGLLVLKSGKKKV
jgi:Na+:H+ antiporter, NhaA family